MNDQEIAELKHIVQLCSGESRSVVYVFGETMQVVQAIRDIPSEYQLCAVFQGGAYINLDGVDMGEFYVHIPLRMR